MSWDASLVDDRGHVEGDWNYTQSTYWLAGLLEGEACFRLRRNRGRVGPDIQVNMTDEDVIRRIGRLAQVGTIHGPYQQPGNRKPFWVWKVAAANDAITLMRRVLPYMGQRRSAQIVETLAAYEAQPLARNRQPRPATNLLL